MVKILSAVQETLFYPWVWKIPLRRKWQLTPVFFPRKIPWTEEPGKLQPMGSQGSKVIDIHYINYKAYQFYGKTIFMT